MGFVKYNRAVATACLVVSLCSFLCVVNGAADFETNLPFHAQAYSGGNAPRGLLIDEEGDLLVLNRGGQSVQVLYETREGQNNIVNRLTIVDGSRLNHGIAYNNGFLYASSTTAVYRWPYTPGQRQPITASAQNVITAIPSGGHDTRTLAFDSQGRLYMSIGSSGNIDANSDRARIMRYNVSNLPQGGIQWLNGEVFADGLRNEVGLAFDSRGVLWGVENSGDNLNREDLGGDIHNGNPAEEMNQFNGPVGTFYGYPYCFSTYDLPGYAKNTQFAWPSSMNDGVHNDTWCKNPNNNRPPAVAMPSHNAPLGITFYDGTGCDSVEGSFPCSMTGDIVVAFHGSWNRNPKAGYRVTLFPVDKATGLPTGEEKDIMFTPNVESCNNCLRPVNAVFNKQGHLIVSTDTSGEIFRVFYDAIPPPVGGRQL